MIRNALRVLFTLMALPLFVACPFTFEEDDSEQEMLTMLAFPIPLEINGHWDEGYATHDIQASKTLAAGGSGYWNSSGTGNTTYARVVAFDNEAQVLYKYVTGCTEASWCTVGYSRVFWTYSEGNLYYCDENFGKPTLQEAIEDPIDANPANLTAGCGPFPWSKLSPL